MVALHLKDPLQVIICFRAFSYFLVGVIIFGSVRFLSKKVTKPKFFFLKKKTETGSNRPVSVRFGSVFLGQKPVWLGFSGFGSVFSVLAWFFPVFFGLAMFFRFGSVFPVWLGFLSVSVRFGFFSFWFIKPKPNQTSRFFQKFNRFFFSVQFFLFRFSRFNRFSGFFAHP